MKKSILALAAVGLLTLVSCKKDYACTCTASGVVYEDSDFNGVEEAYPFTNTYNVKIEGANKTQAVAACNEATIKEQNDQNVYERTCDLSK